MVSSIRSRQTGHVGNSIRDGVLGAIGLTAVVVAGFDEKGSFFMEGKVVDGVVEDNVTEAMNTT